MPLLQRGIIKIPLDNGINSLSLNLITRYTALMSLISYIISENFFYTLFTSNDKEKLKLYHFNNKQIIHKGHYEYLSSCEQDVKIDNVNYCHLAAK